MAGRETSAERSLRLRPFRLLTLVGIFALAAYLLLTLGQVAWAARLDQGDEPADAAVVLGAAQYNGTPSRVLAARLDRAHELYTSGTVETIVVTGGGQEGDLTTEAKTGFDYLRERGVPEEDILLEVDARNTWESMLALDLIMANHDLDTVVLVSDSYHSLRLKAIADDLGIAASVAPASGRSGWRPLVLETVAVSAGRVVGFRRI